MPNPSDRGQSRLERPQNVEMGIEPDQMQTSATIDWMLYEDKPLDQPAKENALYLPRFPVSERDELLGRYIATWNAVERVIREILIAAMNGDFKAGYAIFSIGLSIQPLFQLIHSLVQGSATQSEKTELEAWLARYKKANTKRNRIVHADWVVAIRVGVTAEGEPYVTSYQWKRMHTPGDPNERKLLSKRDRKAIAKYITPLSDFASLIKGIATLGRDGDDLAFVKRIPLQPLK